MKCVKSVFLTKKDFRGNKLETFYLLSFVIFDDFCFCFNASCCGRRSENKNLLNHRTVRTRKLWNRTERLLDSSYDFKESNKRKRSDYL